MPFPSFEKLSELLPQQTLNWARQVAAQVQGWLSIEHHDDGTHSDITADSITFVASAAPIVLVDENGVLTTLSATDRGSVFDGESVLRISTDIDGSQTGPAFIDIGYLTPHQSGYTDGPGVFIHEGLSPVLDGTPNPRHGWAITASIFDTLLSGRTMLAITDTREDKGILALRPIGAPGAVSGYVFGPLSGGTAALGTPLYLGRAANGERWTAIHAIDITATGAVTASTLNVTSFTVASLIVTSSVVSPAYIVGTADTNGIRLDLESGVLAVREGDDSAYGDMLARSIISTSGYLQSQSSYLYLGAAAVAADLLLRKLSSGTLAIRVGDDSGYADVYLKNLVVTDARLHLGPLTTSGALIRLNSGTPELREGDDSDYNDLILRDLAATGKVGAAAGSSGAPSHFFTNDTDSGFFSPAGGSIGVAGNAAQIATFTVAAGSTGDQFTVSSRAFGAGAVGGSLITIGANSSGGGAAGALGLQQKGGAVNYLWSDNSSLIRVNGGPPSENGAGGFTDTAGTVVGDQTSQRSAKVIFRERFDYDVSLNHVLDAPVFDFTYKDGRYNGETFTGITTDDSPVFGKDAGKALSEVTAIGHLIQAIKAQQSQLEKQARQIDQLQEEVNILQGKRVE